MEALQIVWPVLAGAWTGAAVLTAWREPEHPRPLALGCGLAAAGFAATASAPSAAPFFGAAAGAAVTGCVVQAVRYRTSTRGRAALQWTAAAVVLTAGYLLVIGALHVMTRAPHPFGVWTAGALVAFPIAPALASTVRAERVAAWTLRESVGAAGAAVVVAAAYLVIVTGIDGPPRGHERQVLLASLAAALVGGLLAQPARLAAMARASTLIGEADPSTEEVVTTFGARMTRSVPMDELLLQLAESLHASVAHGGAEIWTGTGGVLTRAASVPSRPAGRMELAEREQAVFAHARIGGPHWTSVWLPRVYAELADGADVRVVPLAHLGTLHGLIVVRRLPDEQGYNDDDERALVDMARQLGLALHNVRLDSALQASLAELAQRNEELRASRLRIVAAADASRREIERNLHDGAQQHLVALAVKLGLARQIAEDGDSDGVLELLESLRSDVQTTIGELRELAHGIYPPLLRDRGLAEALRTAALRCLLPTTVDVELSGRYPEQVESAAYFCCLEAMQNAGKYAGAGATLTVQVRGDDAALCFEIADDGAGFDASGTQFGHGFVNMQDRLGAIGGQLRVESTPGKGTAVRATIPARSVTAG